MRTDSQVFVPKKETNDCVLCTRDPPALFPKCKAFSKLRANTLKTDRQSEKNYVPINYKMRHCEEASVSGDTETGCGFSGVAGQRGVASPSWTKFGVQTNGLHVRHRPHLALMCAIAYIWGK